MHAPKLIAPRYKLLEYGVAINVYHANGGEGLPAHSHEYSHLTCCHNGSILVRKENIEKILTKNDDPIMLKPIEWHEITALEDNTVFVNIFAEGKY